MSRGCLAGRPYPRDTRETQLSPSYPNSSHSNMCKSHGSLRRMLSRKLPTKTLQSSIAWVFTHSLSITQPLQSNPTINTGYKRLNKITIKFGTELKPTKHIIVNNNFTNSFSVHFGLMFMIHDIFCYSVGKTKSLKRITNSVPDGSWNSAKSVTSVDKIYQIWCLEV